MPDPHLRAADTDRAAVADQLGEHMSAGRLTVAEYDERLARTYAARTYGELAEITADLPVPKPTPPTSPAAATPAVHSGATGICGAGSAWGGWAGGDSRRAAWASWLGTAVIVLTIWLATSIAAGDLLYPWPVWVIGPWGAVLLAQSITGRGDDGGRRRLR
ncbi:DUF1707 domain-containing protein [Geodermatophilus sp. SYSU D00965]